MNIIIRNLLIVTGVFILFAWLQYREDMLNKKKVSSLYEKYKKPLLFASIIGLILHLNLSNCTNIFIEDIKLVNATQKGSDIAPQSSVIMGAANNEPEMYTTLAKF
jgi:hypothetical protein